MRSGAPSSARRRLAPMARRQPVSEPPSGPAAADEAQRSAPYLDALVEYAGRRPARLHVPGHKGGPGADPQLAEAVYITALFAFFNRERQSSTNNCRGTRYVQRMFEQQFTLRIKLAALIRAFCPKLCVRFVHKP